MPEDIRLGQHFMKSGVITETQLDEALEIQKDLGGKLGRILIKLGHITEDDLLNHLARQLEVEVVRLSKLKIPPALWRMISANTIRAKKIVPISLTGGVLTVATASPQDLEALEEIKFETGENVAAVLASEREIDEMIALFFGPSPTEALTEEIEAPETAPPPPTEEAKPAAPPPSPEAVKQAVEQAVTKEARESLLRFPTRLKIDALIVALLDAGAINEETLNRLIRERAKQE